MLSIKIANAIHPVKYEEKEVNSKTYASVRKKKPKPQYPRLIGDWNKEDFQCTMKPRAITQNMNCKLIPVKIRTVTWRILNRAYKLGTHSGNDYPYKECTIRGTQIAGISHRYFECPMSKSFWVRTHEEIWAPRRLLTRPGKDIFFKEGMQEAPPKLRAIYYQLALHQMNATRRAFVIDQTEINIELMVTQWKASIAGTLERISKFGNLIPGKQS
ncbi:hypothetical protein DSO57_1005190 [Entomophthora muscae]|uniref:Uncharacterized protein n=1 Tax=Entomophthora muscae TaxID=34485 RepID=A0ACC2SKZ8_9FUNG|nr:hypothetical protein DSO57_1005190 [Entomophthora muscae]